MLTLKEFKEARGVLSGVIRNTSLVYSPAFSKATGNQIYIKPENMQVTGAYKIRGAYYKISTLSDEEKARGLVTASAGNHAQGVAYAAQAAGVSATIVMPTTTPLVKVNNTKDYGAKVVLHGETFDDAAELAAKLSEEEGLTYVHPFNDPAIATGQGTISYEIFQDLPDVDVILVPIGGGGLATRGAPPAPLPQPQPPRRTGHRRVHPGQAPQPQRDGHRRGALRRGLHEGQPGRRPCGHPGPGGDHRRRRGRQNPRRPNFPLYSEKYRRHHYHP